MSFVYATIKVKNRRMRRGGGGFAGDTVLFWFLYYFLGTMEISSTDASER